MQYNDFPPGLDTPFNHMLAYLHRVVQEHCHKEYINYLSNFHFYYELSVDDKNRFNSLLEFYGFYDSPQYPVPEQEDPEAHVDELSMEELLDSIRRMIGEDWEGSQ